MMSSALGYQAIVHMSSDAKQWKKDYLRAHGVTVVEYSGDYGKAVEEGRAESDHDPMSYFVDDENSVDLFLGYAVSAERLDRQLREAGVDVDEKHPLFVYIPCGVGGAPGGVTFGLKELYGSNVHVFFVEPTQACCMLLGLATGLHNRICVQDVGLTGKTHADGLAVGRPSGFVGGVMESMLSGEMTIEDAKLYEYLRDLWNSEGIFIEPSACAAFHGVFATGSKEMQEYIDQHQLRSKMGNVTHIAWATGGQLVPEEMRREFLGTYL
jgi:D-serine dehydratase